MELRDEDLRPVAEALSKMDNQDKTDALIKIQRNLVEVMDFEDDLMKMDDDEIVDVLLEWSGEDELRKAASMAALGRWGKMKAMEALRAGGRAAVAAGRTAYTKGRRNASLGYRAARDAASSAASSVAGALPSKRAMLRQVVNAKRGVKNAASGVKQYVSDRAEEAQAIGRGIRRGGLSFSQAGEHAGREFGELKMKRMGVGTGMYNSSGVPGRLGVSGRNAVAEYGEAGREVGRKARIGAIAGGAGLAAAGAGYGGYRAYKSRANKADESMELEKSFTGRVKAAVSPRGRAVIANAAGRVADDAWTGGKAFASRMATGTQEVITDASDAIASGAQRLSEGGQYAAKFGRVKVKQADRAVRNMVGQTAGSIASAYRAGLEAAGDIGAAAGRAAEGVYSNHVVRGLTGKRGGIEASGKAGARLSAWNNRGREAGQMAYKAGLVGAGAAAAGGAAYGVGRLTQKQIEQRRAAGKASAEKRRRY